MLGWVRLVEGRAETEPHRSAMKRATRGKRDAAAVAAIIVNYRTPDLTQRCLAALGLERRSLPNLRAVVVDGGSDDGSADQLARTVEEPGYRDWVSFLPLSLNGGFGWANNQAMLDLALQVTPPEFMYLINPDAEAELGAVGALIGELAANPDCGAAGSQLLDANGDRTASAFRFPSGGREFINAAQSEKLGRLLGIGSTVMHSETSCDVDWVTGASVMLRTQALQETGLFDDGFFLYFDEVELMHRMRERGWGVRFVPASRVRHLEGAATGIGEKSKPLPPYWYESRRRYFALTNGISAVFRANLAWLAGRAVIAAKRLAFGRQARNPVQLTAIWLARGGATPSFPRLGDEPGRPPAWMSRARA